MSNQSLIDSISLATLVIFLIGLGTIMFKQLDRVRRIRKAHLPIPPALTRDILWWTLVSVIIIVPLINVVLNGDNLSDNLWWVITRSIAAIAAVGIWLYYELFVLKEHTKDGS